MNKKFFIPLVGIIALAPVIFFTAFFAQDPEMSEKQVAAENEHQALLVEGKDISISVEKFLLYKSNIEEINQLTNQPVPSDDDLLKELIKEQLVNHYAKELGIVATQDEIMKAINEQREMYENPESYMGENAENNKLVKSLMENRIRASGLTNEEYWESDMVKSRYEEAILKSKLYEQLSKENVVNSLDDFERIQNQLFTEHEPNLKINKQLIKQ